MVAVLAARLVEVGYRTDTADDKKKGAVEALKDLFEGGASALAQTIADNCPPDPDGPAITLPGATPSPRATGRTCPPRISMGIRW